MPALRHHAWFAAMALALSLAGSSRAGGLAVSGWTSSDSLGSMAFLNNAVFVIDNFCIGSQSGNYAITFQGANQSGVNFRMASGSASLNYLVEFAPNGTNFSAVSPGVVVANVTALKSCSAGSNNVALRLTVSPSDFNAAPIGSYGDTLTAVISGL